MALLFSAFRVPQVLYAILAPERTVPPTSLKSPSSYTSYLSRSSAVMYAQVLLHQGNLTCNVCRKWMKTERSLYSNIENEERKYPAIVSLGPWRSSDSAVDDLIPNPALGLKSLKAYVLRAGGYSGDFLPT